MRGMRLCFDGISLPLTRVEEEVRPVVYESAGLAIFVRRAHMRKGETKSTKVSHIGPYAGLRPMCE